MKKKFLLGMSTTQVIMLSFLMAILVGSLLLTLPVSVSNGQAVSYIDALFTATTSICVTGLVTVPTVTTWSLFGQVVILILIQIGGLGVITVMSGVMLVLHRRFGIGDRVLIQDAFNLDTLSGLVKFIKKVLLGTFVVEGIGALLYMFVFVPQYGAKGIWISIFNSVSAFCNAGMDILSENSLCEYSRNPMVNLVTSLLIILGGLGYIVWWDLLRVMKNIRKQKWKCFGRLTLHSKIVLFVTGSLILGGGLCILMFEYHNPLTIGGYSLFDKIQVALFQSVTTRTAGFATVPQQNLTDASALVSIVLMLIGGSPVGTAGGMKTVTVAVLLASAFATIRNGGNVVLFDRAVARQAIDKAVTVAMMFFLIVFTATVLLVAVMDISVLDATYEVVSAAATVGLSRNLTPSLNVGGKIIIIAAMYLGRVGPISLLVVFHLQKKNRTIIKYPVEKISIG